MVHLNLLTTSISIITGLVAGVIDTIAGGGGMITVPVLLALGLTPAQSLGTNRFQSIVGESTATLKFMQSGHLKLSSLKMGFLFTVIGSALGTVLVQQLHPHIMNKIIPILLLLLLLYSLFSAKFVHQETEPKFSKLIFFVCFGLGIGFYNGFFGPSTGSFWIAAFLIFLGFNLKNSVMHAKPLNLMGNITSFTVFALGGHVAYVIGMFMAVGQLIGAQIGAHLVIHKGTAFIRPVFITMVVVMTGYLFLKAF